MSHTQVNTTQKEIFWPTTLFLTISPIVMLVTLPIHFYLNGFHWGTFIFALIFAAATNLSITAGYHRHFAHRSYDVHTWVQIVYLLIGASAFQGSALKWSSDHRVHHSKVDEEEDPYSIKKGFWYAHIGWLFFKDSVDRPIHAPDLAKNKWVYLQDKYYIPLAIFMGFICPMIIGAAWGDFWGGFLVAGLTRIVLTQQSTFFVNSLCHTFGRRTYSNEISAKDSLFVAFLTHGEGYHNFHHRFQIDYRNGIKWYQWDPTKWTIQLLAFFGQAKNLRTVSAVEILKAKLKAAEVSVAQKGLPVDRLAEMRERMVEIQNRMRQLKLEYSTLRLNMKNKRDQRLEEFRTEMKLAKIEFHSRYKQWKAYLRHLEASQAIRA